MSIPPIDDFEPRDLENQREAAQVMVSSSAFLENSVNKTTEEGSWILQSAFSKLPLYKKTLSSLAFAVGGSSLLGVGLTRGDRALIGAGASFLGVAFLSAVAFCVSEQARTQSKDAVIAKLHQLIRHYPDVMKATNGEGKFKKELKAICRIYIEEVPVSARSPENNNILFARLLNASERFFCSLSLDEQKEEENIADIKTILSNIVIDFCAHAREVSERVQRDKLEIQNTFFSDCEIGDFTLKMASGETHHQGRGVVFVTFNADGSLQVVYKPRDLRIDALIVGSTENNPSLYALVNELIHTTMSSQLDLPTYKFLPMERGGMRYGYAEFLSHGPDDYTLNREEMKEYYQIMGGIQLLSQIFGITDLHRENMIVYKKKPCLSDLEVSFDLQSIQQNNSCSTNLNEAINVYGSLNSQKGAKMTRTPTLNRVRLCEGNEIQEMDEHYIKNYEVYSAQMKEGFYFVKNLVINSKDRLSHFIDKIPHDIQTRFLPVNTKQLLGFMQGTPSSVIYSLREMLIDECSKLSYEIRYKITDPQVKEDVLHWDIPRMTTDLYGSVHYNGVHFLDCREDFLSVSSSVGEKEEEKTAISTNFHGREEFIQSLIEPRVQRVKKILFRRLDEIENMQLDEDFKERLCKFVLYEDMIFCQKKT